MSERVYLEQGSDEWHEYRFDHRNASEAGTVMHCNPYQTPYQLRVIKETRIDSFEGNVATRHGDQWEPTARRRVSEILGIELEPAVFREGVYSASLDAYGESENENVKVEIKCPFQMEDSRLWRQAQIEGSWDQLIAEHYMWQVVHQELVIPTTKTYFFIYIPPMGDKDENYALIECFPTIEQIETLTKAWDAFFDSPPGAAGTTRMIAGAKARNLVAEREKWKGQLMLCETELKRVEDDLKRLAGSQDTEFPNGLTYVWKERKGAVDTKKLAEAGIDVDAYRKAPSRYQTFVQKKGGK